MRQLSFVDLAALYRAVLRANRAALPPPLRALGDGYAADEFRRHLRAKTTAGQWGQFAAAWRDYAERLGKGSGGGAVGGAGTGGGAAGEGLSAAAAAAAAAASAPFSSLGAIISDASGDLPSEVIASLSREQRQQLDALRRAAEALARGSGGEGEEGDEEGGGNKGGAP